MYKQFNINYGQAQDNIHERSENTCRLILIYPINFTILYVANVYRIHTIIALLTMPHLNSDRHAFLYL